MEPASGGRSPAVYGAVTMRVLDDRERGTPRTPESYRRDFPGFEDVVDAALEALRARPADASHASHAPDGVARIGRFAIVGELGRGAQGVVYLADDERLGRRVALKVLRVGRRAPDGWARFGREALTTSRLNLPGVCPVYDTGVDDGVPWIAMAAVDGATLAQRIAEARRAGAPGACALPEVASDEPRDLEGAPEVSACLRVALFFERTARRLHDAHAAGVLHRDLKPANLMIGRDGQPVLLDFGVAARADDDGDGEIGGTPGYMPPECFAEGARPDVRADVFALGASLREALTLRSPRAAPTRERLRLDGAALDFDDPRRDNPAISTDLAAVVATALDPHPDRRYRTAEALAEDLRRVRRREPVVVRLPGPVERFGLWRRRNPRLATAVAAIFVLLSGALALTATWLVDESRARAAIEDLSDLKRLDDLRRWEVDLFPLGPDRVDGPRGADAWLLEARSLLAREAEHREAYDRLSPAARAVSRPARDADDWPPVAPPDPVLSRKNIDGYLAPLRSERAAALGALALTRAGPMGRHQARPTEPTVFESASARVAWRIELHARILDGLSDLRAHVLWIEAWRDFARDLRRRTIDDRRAAWADATADAADPARSPAYGGLRLPPQLGLDPLGRDPRSGLLEFAFAASGETPARGADGALRFDQRSALVFVLVPGGRTVVGAQASRPTARRFDPAAAANEGPVTEAELAPYLISKFEMTQGQWFSLDATTPSRYAPGWDPADGSHFEHDLSCPVESVSWEDCVRVLRSFGMDLPTEAQWEHAARGSEDGPWIRRDRTALGSVANLLDARYRRRAYASAGMNFEEFDDGYALTARVDRGAPNGFGLHFVHGNVAEWCRERTCYSHDPHPRPGDGLEQGEGTNSRMLRGGGFLDTADAARLSARTFAAPAFRHQTVGVRPVLRLR